jgi:REP element-mobilizing transposase RayT
MFFIFNKIEIMARQEILDQYGLNFVTITVVDWVDVFIRKEYKELIIESLHFCQKDKGLLVFCYVIMSNHLHLIYSRAYVKTRSSFLHNPLNCVRCL